MRLEKLENLLELASAMQANRQGISIQDIIEKFSVSRRTAIRMKNIISNVFPLIKEVKTDSRIKRWTIPSSTLEKIVSVDAEEFASLEIACKLLKKNVEMYAQDVEKHFYLEQSTTSHHLNTLRRA